MIMWTFNATLDHEVPCASVGRLQSEAFDGTTGPHDNLARSKDCTGVIPAFQKHYDEYLGIPEDLRLNGPNGDRYCQFCVREMNDHISDPNDKPILVRVELTFSDGTIKYLEDEAADDWSRKINAGMANAWVHGNRANIAKWKERSVEINAIEKALKNIPEHFKKPSHETIVLANQHLVSARCLVATNDIWRWAKWQEPHITPTPEGDISFEWWNSPRKLTWFINHNGSHYLESWGPNIVSEMLDSTSLSFQDRVATLKWLF